MKSRKVGKKKGQKERRRGKLDPIYKRLVSRGIVVDRRKR